MPRKKQPPTSLLPVTVIEAEARLFAKYQYTRLREPIPEYGRSLFDPEFSHLIFKRMIKARAQFHPHNMVWAIDLAVVHREPAAHEALSELISERQDRGEELGPQLTAYDQRLKVFPFKGLGGSARYVGVNDLMHAMIMLDLYTQFPEIKLTRKQIGTKKRPSVCSIVADAAADAGLGRGGEDAFRKIYEKYSPALLHGHHWP